MCTCDEKIYYLQNIHKTTYIYILNNLLSKQNDVQQLLKAYMCRK